jgi:hypothetical protein
MASSGINVYADIDIDGGHGDVESLPDPSTKINSIRITDLNDAWTFTFYDKNIGPFFLSVADAMSERVTVAYNVACGYQIENNHHVTITYDIESQQLIIGNHNVTQSNSFQSTFFIERSKIVNVLNKLFGRPLVEL